MATLQEYIAQLAALDRRWQRQPDQETELIPLAKALLEAMVEVEKAASNLADLNTLIAHRSQYGNVMEPLLRRLMPRFNELQRHYATSRSWLSYQIGEQPPQEVFTLRALKEVAEIEESLRSIQLTAEMEDPHQGDAQSWTITVRFTFGQQDSVGVVTLEDAAGQIMEFPLLTASYGRQLNEREAAELTDEIFAQLKEKMDQ